MTRSRLTFVAALSAMLLAGCATPAPAPTQQGASTEPVTRGGTFAYGARGGAQHLNWYAEFGGAAGITFSPIYEPLVSFDFQPGQDFRTEFKVVAKIAESWERMGDSTYVFKIRPNAVWHDGQPVTAADVVHTYEYARDVKNNFRMQANLASVDKIEQVDSHTLRLTTRGPAPNLLRDLSEYALAIYPKHVADSGRKYEDVAIGTGPFKLETYNRASGATYIRHDRYWKEGTPFLDRIKVNWPLDNSALLAAFATGQNDIIQLQDTAQLDTAKSFSPTIQVGEYVSDNEDGIYMRIDRKPFSDIRVRRALHLAINREGLREILWQGRGTINPPAMNGARTGWVIPADELLRLPGYRQPKDQDLAEAKRLLGEAGYPQGFRFPLKYNQTHTRAPQTAQVMAEQLKAIGVQAELAPTERAAYTKDQKDGNFEAVVDTTGAFDPVAQWRATFHSKGGLNGGQINDPEMDRLLDRLDVTLDVEEQKRTYIAIQRLLLDKVYAIAGSTPIFFAGWQPWVKDYVFNPAGQSYPRNWATLKIDTTKAPKDR